MSKVSSDSNIKISKCQKFLLTVISISIHAYTQYVLSRGIKEFSKGRAQETGDYRIGKMGIITLCELCLLSQFIFDLSEI